MHVMDWMTLSIEVVGIAILIIWTYLPIREFRLIHRRLKDKAIAKSPPAEDGK
jgi:hypothetical protein